MNNENFDRMLSNLRKRARNSHLEGMIYIFIIIAISISVMLYFVKYGDSYISITSDHSNINVNNTKKISDIIIDVILNFGAVAISVYLIKILVDFVRYRFTVSEIHYSNADALILSEGDFELFSKFSKKLNPQVEFSKSPAAPYEKIIDLLKK